MILKFPNGWKFELHTARVHTILAKCASCKKDFKEFYTISFYSGKNFIDENAYCKDCFKDVLDYLSSLIEVFKGVKIEDDGIIMVFAENKINFEI